VVTVTRIDRLARSTFDLFAIVKQIVDAKAQFRSLAEPWADTGTSTGRLMIAVLGGLPDVERDLIRTRTAEGPSLAQKRGQRMGRKPKLTEVQQDEARRRLDLWCRAFDDYVVEVRDEYEAAFSSGYEGQRAIRTWRERLDVPRTARFHPNAEKPRMGRIGAGPELQRRHCNHFSPFVESGGIADKKPLCPGTINQFSRLSRKQFKWRERNEKIRARRISYSRVLLRGGFCARSPSVRPDGD
jgi:hypothetical protein